MAAAKSEAVRIRVRYMSLPWNAFVPRRTVEVRNWGHWWWRRKLVRPTQSGDGVWIYAHRDRKRVFNPGLPRLPIRRLQKARFVADYPDGTGWLRFARCATGGGIVAGIGYSSNIIAQMIKSWRGNARDIMVQRVCGEWDHRPGVHR